MKKQTPYPKTMWERKNLVRKKPDPITNAFAYNPRKVIKPAKFQTGTEKNALKDERKKALAPGKRISKSGKVYYEYRANRSDLPGKIK
jgi:hypothetical protein